MHILCIEDRPADTELVVRMTRSGRHEGVFVADLEAAREALQTLSPDLILIDVVLNSNRVGDEFVQELRAQGYTQPIIAVTALALPKDIQQCLDAGFTEVLTKPYEISQLAAIFAKYQTNL